VNAEFDSLNPLAAVSPMVGMWLNCVFETPEGRSILTLYGAMADASGSLAFGAAPVPFSAQTRMSGVDLPDGQQIRKGAADAVIAFVQARQGRVPEELNTLVNVMNLHSPTSAILSAVIFNALIIPALIPIALKGVAYRPLGADALLRRNLVVWGLGGVVIPFVGINLIDLALVATHLTV
jgi:high-affinity K+ transport system ATPase subunit B